MPGSSETTRCANRRDAIARGAAVGVDGFRPWAVAHSVGAATDSSCDRASLDTGGLHSLTGIGHHGPWLTGAKDMAGDLQIAPGSYRRVIKND